MRAVPPSPFSLAPLVLLATLVAWPAGARPPEAARPPAPGGVARSQWWDEIEAADALIQDGKWRKARALVAQTLDQTLRQGWQEPDLGSVLAAESLQRAVIALHRGETAAALWHWDVARNLDSAVEERLERYGALAEPLRERPLRGSGRLPDGTRPPARFATPGYEPLRVGGIPPTREIENAWFHQVRTLPTVRVEVVVDATGALSEPVVASDRYPPVLVLWTLEQIRIADVDVRPARLDGQPIDDLTTIEMDFQQPRW